MGRQKQLKILKAICWMGAIADAFWTIALLWPEVFVMVTGNTTLVPDLSIRLVMGIGASLMAGWTCLLIWASNNPIERRMVLLFTVFPVVAGLACVNLIGMLVGSSPAVWIFIKLIILTCVMLYGFHKANRIAKGDIQ